MVLCACETSGGHFRFFGDVSTHPSLCRYPNPNPATTQNPEPNPGEGRHVHRNLDLAIFSIALSVLSQRRKTIFTSLSPVYTCDLQCDFWCDFAYETRVPRAVSGSVVGKRKVLGTRLYYVHEHNYFSFVTSYHSFSSSLDRDRVSEDRSRQDQNHGKVWPADVLVCPAAHRSRGDLLARSRTFLRQP